jgi:hypothetical protein
MIGGFSFIGEFWGWLLDLKGNNFILANGIALPLKLTPFHLKE